MDVFISIVVKQLWMSWRKGNIVAILDSYSKKYSKYLLTN